MTVIIRVTELVDWQIWNWAFRALNAEARPLLSEPDRLILTTAEALQLLDLCELPEPEARRLAEGLSTAAQSLGVRLRATPEDPRDLAFAAALDELVTLLSKLSAE